MVGAGAGRRPRVQAEAPGTRPGGPCRWGRRSPDVCCLGPRPSPFVPTRQLRAPAVRVLGAGASGQAKGHRGGDARAGPEQGLLGLLSVFVHCFKKKKKKFSVHSIGGGWGVEQGMEQMSHS